MWPGSGAGSRAPGITLRSGFRPGAHVQQARSTVHVRRIPVPLALACIERSSKRERDKVGTVRTVPNSTASCFQYINVCLGNDRPEYKLYSAKINPAWQMVRHVPSCSYLFHFDYSVLRRFTTKCITLLGLLRICVNVHVSCFTNNNICDRSFVHTQVQPLAADGSSSHVSPKTVKGQAPDWAWSLASSRPTCRMCGQKRDMQ